MPSFGTIVAYSGLATVAAALAVVALAGEAEAAHLRGGHLTWNATSVPRQVEFTGWWAQRADPLPALASLQPIGNLAFGDGSSVAVAARVRHVDAARSYWHGSLEISGGGRIFHVYPSPDDGGLPWVAALRTCCRLAEHDPFGNYHPFNHGSPPTPYSLLLETFVDLSLPNSAPWSPLDHLVYCPESALCTFTVPTADADGDPVSVRFATTDEATGLAAPAFQQPTSAAGPLAVGLGGAVSWDTTGAPATLGERSVLSIALVLEDGRSKTPLDFMIELVPSNVTAEFTWIGACARLPVTFTDLSWTSPSPPLSLTTSFWDFGDFLTMGPMPWTGTVTHTYSAPGVYLVTLEVWNSVGHSATVSYLVEVFECAITWAAGDQLGGEIAVAGNDPGCGLGDAASAAPAPADKAWSLSFDPSLGPPGVRTPLPDLLAPRALAAGATRSGAGGEALLVAGGTFDCTFVPRADAEMLPLGGPAWTPAAPLSRARIAPASATDGTRVWVVGGDGTGGYPGLTTSWHVPTAALEEGNGAAPWAPRASAPAGLTGSAAMWDPETRRLVVSGGAGHPQTFARLVQTFDPATNRWDGDHMPPTSYRTGHAAASCGGLAYVMGGLVGEAQHAYHYRLGAGTASSMRGLGAWAPAPALPQPLAYAAAASAANGVIYVTGGWNTATGAFSGSTYMLACTGVGTWVEISNAAPKLAESVAVVSGPHLYLLGGTPTTIVHPANGRVEGGCPEGATFARLNLLAPALGWETLPGPPGFTYRASAGAAALPDGTIVYVGGRARGPGNSPCMNPVADVSLWSPVTRTWSPGPALPEGLIAPAVNVVGWRVFVAGGDETGDVPDPAFPMDPRPRRPSSDLYMADFTPGLTPPAWTPMLDDAPLGVIHGEMVRDSRGLHVIGGSHHPNATTRLVQTLLVPDPLDDAPVPHPLADALLDLASSLTPTTSLAPSYPTWEGPHLRMARAHHTLERCDADGAWVVYGGLAKGSVYWTRPGPATLYAKPVDARPPGGAWAHADTIDGRAFPVGESSPEIAFATGTTPSDHRTWDVPTSVCAPFVDAGTPQSGGLAGVLAAPLALVGRIALKRR